MNAKAKGTDAKPTGVIDREMMNNEWYGLLVESIQDYAIILLDETGHVVSWNPAAQRLKGWKHDEIIGQSLSVFYPPEDIAAGKPQKELDVAVKDGRFEDEGWRVRKDGSRFWANVVFTPLRDKEGKLCGFGKITRDLTERNIAEERQRSSSAYARSLIEASLDPLITLSAQGKITDVNEASVQATGVPREKLIGTDFSDYFTEPEAARVGYQKVFSEGFVRDYPLSIRHTSGRITDVLYNASVYKDDQGNVLGVFASARDVTERKIAERRIKKQAMEILEMATVPVVQVWEGVVLVPLIGMLDSSRTQQLMERLLQKVTDTTSRVAVIDITGVPTIDTQTAQHLIETVAAVRLLGAEVVLTGIRPVIAQTLVHLGIDLSNVSTQSSLASGLRTALEFLKLQIKVKS